MAKTLALAFVFYMSIMVGIIYVVFLIAGKV